MWHVTCQFVFACCNIKTPQDSHQPGVVALPTCQLNPSPTTSPRSNPKAVLSALNDVI